MTFGETLTRDSMASAIESLVFFSVPNFKGGRYVGIRSIFDAGAIEISPHIDAMPILP